MDCPAPVGALECRIPASFEDWAVPEQNSKPKLMQVYAGISTAAIVVLAIISVWLGVRLYQAEQRMAGAGAADGPPTQQGGDQAQLVRVGTVERERVQRKRLVTGQIEAVWRTTVAAEEAGLVIQSPPDRGTPVKRGDVLAKLDTKLLETSRQVAEAQLNEAEAMVRQVEATLTEAQALVDRYAGLIEEGAITQVEYDRAVRDRNVAEAQRSTAKAAVASRRAEIERISIQLDKMTIRAPFDGSVIAKYAELGQWLAPGGPVAEMVATEQVDAILEVPESMIGAIQPDVPVDVRIPGLDQTFTGRVFRIVPNADREARTVQVLIRLDNPDATIKPGMSAEAELPTGRRIEALTVPRSAVKTTPMGLQVWANRDGVGLPVNVVGKFMVGDRMVIEGNLGPGEQVVVEGNERLFPGVPLNVQNGEAMAATNGGGGPPTAQ